MSNSGDFVIENGVLKKYTGAGGDVVIPDGVTEIGSKSFEWCNGLTGITIPSGVMSIGDNAFYVCTNLQSITIPDSVTSIGNSAFFGCTDLQRVSIPDGVTSIGNSAFCGCKVLQSIVIPASVSKIGYSAFSGCNSLQHVTIPKSIMSIDKFAFSGCENLVCIVAPHFSLADFDTALRRALAVGFAVAMEQGCTVSDKGREEYLKYIKGQRKKLYPIAVKEPALLRLTLSEKMLLDSDFESVRQMVEAENNTELMAMLLDYGNKNVKPVDVEKQFEKEIGAAERQEARAADFVATGVLSAADAKKIWQHEKKTDGTILLKGYKGAETNVVIPNQIGKDKVTEVSEYAFSPLQNGALKTVREARKNITSVAIPDCIRDIGSHAFDGCVNLTGIEIPNKVKSIGENAFSGCTGITSLVIPGSVKKIGMYAFADCTGLTDVTVSVGARSLGCGIFSGCESLTHITIPDSVKEIDNEAFADCKSLTNITVPHGVIKIGHAAFRGCSGLTGITIPDSVTKIGNTTFEGCTCLTDITIPDSVTSIDCFAFHDCPKLTIHAPAGSYAEQYAKENNIPFIAE